MDFSNNEIIELKFSRDELVSLKTGKLETRKYRFPVRIVLTTEKAVLVTYAKYGPSYGNHMKGDQVWIPKYALKAESKNVFVLDERKVNQISLGNFIDKYKIKPLSSSKADESIKSRIMDFSSFLNETEKEPKNLEKINMELKKELTGKLFDEFPFDKIESSLKKYGYSIQNENGIPWSGLISGDSGKASFEVKKDSGSKNIVYISWEMEGKKYRVSCEVTLK